MTLDQDHLRSTTTSRADPSFEKDRLWLNGDEEEIKEGGRMATCIKELKALRRDFEEKNPSEPKVCDIGYILYSAMFRAHIYIDLSILRSH